MSAQLKIELTGQDGSYWRLSGPGAGVQGAILAPNVQQFIDAPVKTLWVPGPFGENYIGKRVQRREMVFSVQIGDGNMSPDTWSTIDSKWRWAFDYDNESTITATTADGVRRLNVRLLEEPKPYNDKDPHLTADNPVVMTVASAFPYWVEDDAEYVWSGVNDHGFTQFPVHNDGDVPVWLRWVLTAPGLWTVPDFSWGNDMYSRGNADLGRMIPLPLLKPNEHISVDSDPRVQTIIAVNDSPVQQRWKGNDLLYPLMPGKTATIPLTLKHAINTGPLGLLSTVVGGAAKLTVPRWFSRPWSSPGLSL